MPEEEVIERLEAEGYTNVRPYEAGPNEVDEEHDHAFDTKLHILFGEIRIKKSSGGVITDFLLKRGDELEILRTQLHSAKAGNGGCRYVVAERHP
jgi:hypothetical protein